jgi:hypothetical protein
MTVADDLLYAPVSSTAPATYSHATASSDIRIPESWLNVIKRLRSYTPIWQEAALAGGCLRDLDLGRSIKDVDIFLPIGAPAPDIALEKALNMGNHISPDYVTIEEIQHDPRHNSATTNGVTALSHFIFYLDGWKFEITQKAEPFTQRTILDSFDLGLCMICLEGDKIYRSPEYQTDAANKSITVVRQTGGREVAHAKRIARKYAGWSIMP